jgi:sulfite reductase beta subunit-like hemoprotein
MLRARQTLGPVEFPTPVTPDDPKSQRLLGLYAMKDPGLFMQRIKVLGGRITPDQWRRLARITAAFTPDYPLHLTTRQAIELHGVPSGAAPRVQEGIADAGLTSIGACGDTPRNITLCPAGGLCGGHGDLMPLVLAARTFLEAIPGVDALPRKFKISFSGCREACAQPWINDMGFVATSSGVFDAIGAGSLGHKPGTGVLLAKGVGVADVFACLLAAVRLFQAHGDRVHRMRARLRHVRERMGNPVFLQLFETELDKARKEGGFPSVTIPPCPSGLKPIMRLSLPNGDLTPAQAERLADLCDAHSARTTLDNQQGIRVFGPSSSLQTALAQDALLAGLARPVSVVACPGVTWCTKGIADSRAMALRLREAVERSPRGPSVTVCVSGCPNQCAQSSVASIGLVGLMRGIGGVRTECFRVLAGGGMGKCPVLGAEVSPALPSAEVPALVQKLLDNWESFISI